MWLEKIEVSCQQKGLNNKYCNIVFKLQYVM